MTANDKDANRDTSVGKKGNPLMNLDLFPCDICSDSDVTRNSLSGHDRFFSDSEVANIHSEMNKIP
jgi:hypothetical protein